MLLDRAFPKRLLSNPLAPIVGELFRTRLSALGSSERGEHLCMRIPALYGLQNAPCGFFHDAEIILYRIGAIAAFTCSGRHSAGMPPSMATGKLCCGVSPLPFRL